MRLKFLPEVFYADKGKLWLEGYFEGIYSTDITEPTPKARGKSLDHCQGWAQGLHDVSIGAVFETDSTSLTVGDSHGP